MARYELTDGRSNKFWEVTVKGTSLTTTYGRIGSAGQSSTKTFASAAAAKAAADKLIGQKEGKGYAKVGGASKVAAKKAVAKKATTKKATKKKAAKKTASEEEIARYEPEASVARGPTHAFVNCVVALSEGYDNRLFEEDDDDDDEMPDDQDNVTRLWERHQHEDLPDGVAWDDNAVSGDLSERLKDHVEQLLAEGRPDYHPGSGKFVRDVVHPSLYPFVKGKTKLAPGAVAPKAPEAGDFDFWGRPYEASKFQWLPTPFAVDRSGGVKIQSYINNLDRNVYPQVYDDLAELFSVALPLFESVYGYAKTTQFVNEAVPEHELPSVRGVAKPAKNPKPITLKGRELQVITKIVEYQIGPKPFEGVWHVEGMSHENIMATGVYVLHRDAELAGGDIQFKRVYTQAEAGQLFWNVAQCRSEAMNEMVSDGAVPVGSLSTPQGRLFVFPNSHIHMLSTMKAVNGAKRAGRRVIVFWLIDPEQPILSTREVRPQQATMSLKDAEKFRLQLMKIRKFHKQSLNERAVSLCEH